MASGSKQSGVGMLVLVVLGMSVALVAVAGEPMFVRWLVADDPGDEAIREYWERAERDELEAPALVDLGTMLFYRGYPKDAVRYFKRALDLDADFYEAWFRIGLVEHSEGNLDNARQAYKRCLKKLTGHGWCNFYLGLLEEQLGHSSDAMHYYRRAFKFAPDLADPKVNPEVMSSQLVLGVGLMDQDRRRFKGSLPMPYLEPDEIDSVKRRHESEPAAEVEEMPMPEVSPPQTEPQESVPQGVEPTPTPGEPAPPPRPKAPRRAPQPTPEAVGELGSAGEPNVVPYGMPAVESTSSEARLVPRRSDPPVVAAVFS